MLFKLRTSTKWNQIKNKLDKNDIFLGQRRIEKFKMTDTTNDNFCFVLLHILSRGSHKTRTPGCPVSSDMHC
jgi:hypothetical protein